MREIKFRGYSPYKSGWVYGDLVHDKKVTATGLEDRVKVGGYEVDPDSVGQFTGLKDSEGKDIYEGDIILCSGIARAVIEWNPVGGTYTLRWLDCGENGLLLYEVTNGGCDTMVISNHYENEQFVKNLRK